MCWTLFCYSGLLEDFANIATIAGGLAIAVGVISYKLNKKQFNFSVLVRCITHFSENFASISNTTADKDLKAYVDFVNEELFYFEKNYIPKDVALEWIDGMIDYMPIYSQGKKKVLNPEQSIKKIDDLKILQSFQRVKKAFTVNEKYDFDKIYGANDTDNGYLKRRKERERLAKEIYGNLNKSRWRIFFDLFH